MVEAVTTSQAATPVARQQTYPGAPSSRCSAPARVSGSCSPSQAILAATFVASWWLPVARSQSGRAARSRSCYSPARMSE